jgi:glutathione synthase
MRILVITIQTDLYKPVNNYLIPRSLRDLGHQVVLADVDTLMLLDNVVHAKAAEFAGGKVGDPHVRMSTLVSCEDFDLIWLLDYAHPSREREFFQLLWVLEQRVTFVNRPSSMFFINNKIGVLGLRAGRHFATTNVLLDEQSVRSVIATDPSSTWVLKPPNSGCGADVFMLAEGDPNYSSLIQSATGNAYQKYEMYTREAYGQAERYTILQRFIPEMRQSENRVIIAGGEVVGGYKKTSTGREFRGNYAVGGVETALDISDEARALCVEIGAELKSYGIHYAGIDLAYPFIVEYNLVNPGGISGQLNATGEDIGPVACSAAVKAATRS